MDDNIRKEPSQLPEEETAQVDSGTIGADELYMPYYKCKKQCRRCKYTVDFTSKSFNSNICPVCAGQLLPFFK